MNVSDEKFCLKVCKDVKALLDMGKNTDLSKYNDIQIALTMIQDSVDSANLKDKERMDALEIKCNRLHDAVTALQDAIPVKKDKKKAKK